MAEGNSNPEAKHLAGARASRRRWNQGRLKDAQILWEDSSFYVGSLDSKHLAHGQGTLFYPDGSVHYHG
jgi:hypothetical protein